ncbi:MAG: MFS transporter, partial [Chthoniobacteraceae bacterium]
MVEALERVGIERRDLRVLPRRLGEMAIVGRQRLIGPPHPVLHFAETGDADLRVATDRQRFIRLDLRWQRGEAREGFQPAIDVVVAVCVRVVGLVRAFGAISLGAATLGLTPLANILSFAPETTGDGWTRAILLVTVIGMGLYLLAFFFVRERDSIAAKKRLSFRELFGALFRNGPLLLVLRGSVLGFGRFIVQAGGAVFAVIAYNDEGLFTLLGAGIILGLVIASFVTPLLLKIWRPRTLAIACGIGGAVISVAMFLFGYQNIVSVIVFLFLTGAAIGVFNVLQPSMIADAVDAAEERTGVRNDGISFA